MSLHLFVPAQSLRSVGAALALCLLGAPVLAQSSLTAGSFAVNDAGAATYSIPLTVAPGAGDLAPRLSLQYSSQAANGVFGVGWTLSGVSSITRCAKSPAEEGDRIGVKNDTSDLFCLDGQKLRAISGTYGASGAQYRTALDTYGRIFSQGSISGGPQYFTLETKTGEIYTFGGDDGSRLQHPSKGVRTWMVSEIRNRFNNRITFSYSKNTTLGEQLLQEVGYSNGRIKLNYEGRPGNDLILKYEDGVQYGSTNSRVSTIEVAHKPLVNGNPTITLLKTYQLQYTQSQASQRSMLRSIKECAADGTCLPAIALTYRDGTPGHFSQGAAHGFPQPSQYASYSYGLRDQQANGKQSVYSFRHNNSYNDVALWDVDGDSRTDILTVKLQPNDSAPPDQEVIQYANGVETSSTWDSTNHIRCFADINGDGKSEAIRFKTESVGSSNAGSDTYLVVEPIGNTSIDLGTEALDSCKSVDVDGDGRSEVLVYQGDGGGFLLTYKGGTWSKLSVALQLSYSHNSLGDINGDGKTDWFSGSRASSTSAMTAAVSQGNGSSGVTAWTTQPSVICTGDFNGDGRTDVLAGNNRLQLSNGLTATLVSHDIYAAAPSSLIACGDFNGDGLMDAAVANYYWYNGLPADVDRLITVNNGAGFTQSVEYKSITDSSVYTKGSGAAYPQVDMQTPIMVTSRVRSGSDAQGWQTTTYRYSTLRADLKRSGTQGFARVTSYNEGTGVSVATDYHQTYPLTGMRSLVRKYVGSEASPQTLELTTFNYLQRGITTPEPTAQAAQVHLTQTISDQFDLLRPGLLLGGVSSVSDQIDTYGYPAIERVERFDGAGRMTSRSITSHQYQHNPSNWLLGQLVKSTVTQDNFIALGAVTAGGFPTSNPSTPPSTPPLSGEQASILLTPILELLLSD